MYGEDLENNRPMRRIPPLNGKIALRYSKSELFGETEFLFATTQSRLSDGDIPTFAEATHVTVGLKGKGKKPKNYEYTVTKEGDYFFITLYEARV